MCRPRIGSPASHAASAMATGRIASLVSVFMVLLVQPATAGVSHTELVWKLGMFRRRRQPEDHAMLFRARRALPLALTFATAVACASSTPVTTPSVAIAAPTPDPRIGLRAGRSDAAQALWNMRLLSNTPSPDTFSASFNSDLAFKGNYAIQGNFNGWQIWDISNPSKPTLTRGFVCPASQSDVSVYGNLLFISGEDIAARLDCGTRGVPDTVSRDRLRGLRVFDISDLRNPRNVANVQTRRGSHTHTLLVDPRDRDNVYVYISGSSPIRSPNELAGCLDLPESDPRTASFRIEVIKVPVSNPSQAAIVSSPRIFGGLVAPKEHGEAPEDSIAMAKELAETRAR